MRSIGNGLRYPALIALCLLAGMPPIGARGSDGEPEMVPGEVLVRSAATITASELSTVRQAMGFQLLRRRELARLEVWEVPEGEEQAVAQGLSRDPRIELAEPNFIARAFMTPNDPKYANQWGHDRIHSEAGWDLTGGSRGVVIAILDSGVDLGHPDLVSKLLPGRDFIDGDVYPGDENGHGTHVAGIAAAVTGNGVGIAGTCWQARLLPVRVLDRQGSGSYDGIIEGIHWAREQGADILNMSLGGSSSSQLMSAALTQARNAGSLPVAAMGNGGNSATEYPAGFASTLAVAATDRDDDRTGYSSYGDHCDIAAPGGDMGYYQDPDGIYSTMPTYPVYKTTHYDYLQNYDYLEGTSMATPYVAGLAALIWSVAPDLSPDGVQSIIEATARDRGVAGWDRKYGHGLIDARAALETVLPPGSGVELSLPAAHFSPGASFGLQATVTNSSGLPLYYSPLMVLLGVEGAYWYAPSWGTAPDAVLPPFPVGETDLPLIPAFPWPDTGSLAMGGLVFYGALVPLTLDRIYGDWDMKEFGFGPIGGTGS